MTLEDLETEGVGGYMVENRRSVEEIGMRRRSLRATWGFSGATEEEGAGK